MADDCIRADDDETSELRADLHHRARGDERALEEVGSRGNLGLGVDDRREVVAAKPLGDVGALRVLADRDEDRRAGIVARRLLDRAENREALEIVALLPLGIVVGVADDVLLRLLGKRVDALNGPDRLAAKAARTYDEKVSHFDLSP